MKRAWIRKSSVSLGATVLFGFAGCAASPLAPPSAPFVNPWTGVRSPVAGPAEAIGAYAAGCLAGAVELPAVGEGYVRVSPRPNRQYGHPALAAFLARVGKAVRAAGERPFLVADLGLPRGGPTLSGHASHQIGLDVDVWFRRDERAADPRYFGRDQRSLLRRFATAEAVERIFVNPAIKRRLCAEPRREAWIRKVRPWYGHDVHFHVRLACPADSPRCVGGDPLPEGDGCDATLAWWDGPEARAEGAARIAKPLALPELPPACADILAVPDVAIPISRRP